MSGAATVQLLPEAADDLAELDGADQKIVLKALKKLAIDPHLRGAPLGSPLTTFRKLVVGNRQFRIVYKVEQDGTVVVVWVIATRVDSECYQLAMSRLALYGDSKDIASLKRVVRTVFGDNDT